MNFVGHIHVARNLMPGEAMVHLGSALPDIAAIGRFRLAEQSSNPLVREGVRLHHRTDEAFHGHDSFLAWNRAIHERLRAVSINRGAARACGHVGCELLLDGHLMRADNTLGPDARAALTLAAGQEADVHGVVPPDNRSDWRQHLDRVATWDLPDDYHEPEAVARRLWRILTNRPRLAFARDEIATVAGVLAEVQPTINSGAAGLLADVSKAVGES